MKAALLGIELGGETAQPTVVERDGSVSAEAREPLDGAVLEWWGTHPEERFRAVLALLEGACAEGKLEGGRIAGIGLTCEPGLVLLDRELEPIRDVPWDDILEGGDRTPHDAIRLLGDVHPRWARHVGTVLSTLDFLRFRMTGALATHAGFAWACDLVAGSSATEAWEYEALLGTGIAPDAFPPIFAASCRVGIIGEEVVERTGIPRGVWVNAGSDPDSAYLLGAGEPGPGTRVALLHPDRVDLWEACAAPEQWDRWWRPLPLDSDLGYRRVESRPRARADGPVPGSWTGERGLVLDFRVGAGSETWPESVSGEIAVAHDAGGPSAAAALQAGLGLGWWRDPRVLWRKQRRPRSYIGWRYREEQPSDAPEKADV